MWKECLLCCNASVEHGQYFPSYFFPYLNFKNSNTNNFTEQ